jgi:hypothetical protein
MNPNKSKIFDCKRDFFISNNNACEIINKNKVTLEKIFKKYMNNPHDSDPKEFVLKIEFIDKQIDIMYDTENPLIKKTIEQLENENSQIKQIIVTTKEKTIIPPQYELEFNHEELKNLMRKKINDDYPDKIFKTYINKTYCGKISQFILDIYEVCLIEIIMEKLEFKEFNNYVYFYLNDNLKKMREANPNKDIRIIDACRKQVEEYLIHFKDEIRDMYQYKHEVIREAYKSSNSEHFKINTDLEEKDKKYFEELTITCIIATKIKNFDELDLSQFYVLNENVLIILTALKVNKSVEKLILTTNKLGNEGAWGLPRIFLYNQKLNYIDISSNGLDNPQLEMIANGLTNLPQPKINLRNLNISSNLTLTKECGKFIAKIIEKTDCLETLNISKIGLSTGFLEIIQAFNSKMKDLGISTIKSLHAISSQIDINSLMQFANFIRDNKCSLNLLILTDNNLDNEGGKKILENLSMNTSISKVYLHDCNLNDENVLLIRKIIEENRVIQELSLYNNKFTSKAINEFLHSLADRGKLLDIEMTDSNNYSNSYNYSLSKFDISKPSNSKDINAKLDDEMINCIKTIEETYKNLDKKFILDMSFNFKLDPNVENEISKINSKYLKIHV